MPAPVQERCATDPATNSHGRSRCSSTAAGRPVVSAARKVGARAHRTPATMRSDDRSVRRVAANQPPSAASGRAATHRITSDSEGAHGVNDPTIATRAANGSAGAIVSKPSARSPKRVCAHSWPRSALSGSTPPPPRTGQARSAGNAAIDTTSAPRTSHGAPPEKKRSSPRRCAPATRSSTGSWSSRSRNSARDIRSWSSCRHDVVRFFAIRRRARKTAAGRTATTMTLLASALTLAQALSSAVTGAVAERVAVETAMLFPAGAALIVLAMAAVNLVHAQRWDAVRPSSIG